MSNSSLMHAAAAVHDDGLAGDEVAVVRGQEDEGADEVVRDLPSSGMFFSFSSLGVKPGAMTFTPR